MIASNITDQLTDEQCDEFRRMPCDLRDMIRAVYKVGFYKGGLATLAKIDPQLDDAIAQLSPDECNNCDLASLALDGLKESVASLQQA